MPPSLTADAPFLTGRARAATLAGRVPTTTAGHCTRPADTGVNGAYAARTANKAYRTTPLRALWQHAPYFHDCSAATLADVVGHYNRVRKLGLTTEQQHDLVEYLKSL
jgi:cytochrome c peroxidase